MHKLITTLAISMTTTFSAAAHAAEPLHPLLNPSLYEQRGVVGSVDTASGAVMIGGKRHKANANTVIFIADAQGRLRKGLTLADIPTGVPVSYATGNDGTITQIFVGNGLMPMGH